MKYCGVNGYHPKFICWNTNPWCDGIWKWDIWEVIISWEWSPYDGISVLIQRDKLGPSLLHLSFSVSVSLLPMWGNQEADLSQNLTMLATTCQTPSLQSLWEIKVCCWNHSLWYFCSSLKWLRHKGTCKMLWPI